MKERKVRMNERKEGIKKKLKGKEERNEKWKEEMN